VFAEGPLSSRGGIGPFMDSLAFLLFQLLTATLFLRPAELFEPLAGLPIYEGLIIGCLLLAGQRMQAWFTKSAIRRQPVVLCAFGLVPAIAISHLTHGYLGGAFESTILMLKTLVYFVLLITIVDTPDRFNRFARTVATCASVMVGLCVVDFLGFWDFQFIEHLVDFDGMTDEDEVLTILRMRGTGIFQDPNDLAMVVVGAGVLCTSFVFNGRNASRWLWLVPISVLGVALILTRSRGGLMAAGIAGLVLVSFRWGPRWGVGLALSGLLILPLTSSRQTEIDFEEGTGQERIQIWQEGFDALKSPDLLFGTGQGTYYDIAGLVAHNSFVHAYVELGIVGGTLFFGCFFFLFYELYRLGKKPWRLTRPDLVEWRPFVAALLAGWCGSMLSLSRCYVVPTFLVIGFGVAFIRLATNSLPTRKSPALWDWTQASRLSLASGLTFVGLYLFTTIMAR